MSIISRFGDDGPHIWSLVAKTAAAQKDELFGNTSTARLIARNKAVAYGEVAADVLGICHTPTAWYVTVKEVVGDNPKPMSASGVAKFEKWAGEVTEEVMRRLGART